jgi:2-succinyl-5-enolpyruvyl-6-hydroxy-3-cyclohexene-1-carboxylate synthase
VFDSVATADPEAIEQLAERLGAAARPLVVAGPGPARQGGALEDLRRLVEWSGALLLADATSQFAPLGDPIELALRTPAGRRLLDADFVLQLGESPIGKGWNQYAPGRRRWILCERGWPDPSGDADGFVFGPIAPSIRALADALARSTKPNHANVQRARLKVVASEAVAELPWGETRALQHIVRAVDASGARLVIGNSSCVRLIDLAAVPQATVHSQRGASGIDGLIAGTCGVATASRAPTVLVLGDVSFLHDVGALQELAKLETPTLVVVLDDGGGRIFEQLPVVEVLSTDAFEAHFALAHRWPLEGFGAAFGIRASSIANLAELDQALGMSLEHAGASVLRVVLPAHSVRDDLAALDAFVEHALAGADA